jgi:LPPG:FO 2-phospho-L-lactate transferase
VSIGPILALPGVRDVIARRRARTVAISPIIGGAAVKGPAGSMLRSLGHEVSAFGVASIYRDVVGTFVLDEVDADLAPRIEALDMRVMVAPTLMTGPAEKQALARLAVGAVAEARLHA